MRVTANVMADDKGRWAQAEQLLVDVDRTGPPRAPGRRWTPGWAIGVSVVVIALAAGIGATVLAGDRAAVPAWREASGLALSGFGFVVAAVAGVWMWRSGQRGGRPPLTVLTREQRRSLQDQIRGRGPVDPVRLRLTRYRASQLSQQAPALLFFAGLCLLEDGQTLEAGDRLLVVLAVAMAIAFVAGSVVVPRQIEQGRAFLGRHPEPDPPEPGAAGPEAPGQQTYVPPAWSAAAVDDPDSPAGA